MFRAPDRSAGRDAAGDFERLSKDIREIAADPVFRKKLMDLGYTVIAGTPKGYQEQIAQDVKDFSQLIPTLNITMK